jgi:hypothetical protein
MDYAGRIERAERTAKAIYHFGFSSLYDSEISALESDKEYNNLVMHYLEVLKRNDLLKGDDKYNKTTDYNKAIKYSEVIDENVDSILFKHFRIKGILFEIAIYENRKTSLSYIELKSYPGRTEEIYSHKMLLSKLIQSNDVNYVQKICRDELLKRGCTSSDIDKAFSEWW